MINGKKILAVIPARGGSKRLPFKNIKPFHGKPLINWTVEAALGCEFIDKIIVSSDSDEILEKATLSGITLDKREKDLASDTASSVDVAIDILNRYGDFDILVWLQPTSPLRLTTHISQSLELYHSDSVESVVSVCESEHSTDWMNTLTVDKTMANFVDKLESTKRSQDLDKSYLINGAIYIIKTSLFEKTRRFIHKSTKAYIMPREASIDIDEEVDFVIAEALKNCFQG